MARTTQEKFIEKMEVVAATYKYDLIINRSFANSGQLRFEDPSSFIPKLDLGFDFQATTVRFYNLPKLRPDETATDPTPQWLPFPFSYLDGVVEAITAWVKR